MRYVTRHLWALIRQFLIEADIKVKDLIAALQGFDPEMDAICYTEDDVFLAPRHDFRILEINDVRSCDGERVQYADGIKSMKFVRFNESQRFALMDVTIDY